MESEPMIGMDGSEFRSVSISFLRFMMNVINGKESRDIKV